MAIQDKAFLNSLIASLFADNNSRDITPQDLRSYLQESLDSKWLQRQTSNTLTNTSITLLETDIDQNKFFLFAPASGQSQTINLPVITAEMVGRQFLCFFDYSNQIGTFVPTGPNTVIGRQPIDAAQAIASVRVLDLDRWAINRVILDPAGIVRLSAVVTDDAGNGSVEDDLNNTDFTGQLDATGDVIVVTIGSVLTLAHKLVVYEWIGPSGIELGLNGNHIALASELVALGTGDHNILSNRSLADQHPQSAITDLVADQSTQDGRLTVNEANIADNTSDFADHLADVDVHQQADVVGLVADQATQDGRLTANETNFSDHLSNPDVHEIADVLGLTTEQTDQDTATQLVQTNLDTHEGAPDPHPLYALETAALAAFTGIGYGGLVQNAASFNIGSLTAAWTTFTGWDAVSISTPKDITQNLAGDSIQFDEEGVWTISVQLTIEHDEQNFGRQVGLRVINATTATPSRAYVFGTGRNQNTTNLTIPSSLVEILLAAEGDDFQIEIGGFDGYLLVDSIGGSFEAVHVSEAQSL